MAYYKYPQYLQQQNAPEFDAVHLPASATPFSGVYRCTGCGLSATSVLGHPLPPQNHHQHSVAQGQIKWQLAVKSHYR